MFQFVVLRGCGLFCDVTLVRLLKSVLFGPPPKPRLKPLWLLNMSRFRLPKKSTGDHCQPVVTSLTKSRPSVERSLIEPTVRYDAWIPMLLKSGPGNRVSALFR